MKKTVIALLAMSGIASAASSVLTFDQNDYSFDTDKWALNGSGNGPGSAWEGSHTLSDGTVASMSITNGKFWDYATVTTSWTNGSAIDTMNADLGTTITSDDLCTLKIDATGAQGSKSTLTFDFSSNDSYSAGDDVVFYLLVATSNDGGNTASYGNFSVTGLEDVTTEWASATGSGFESGSPAGVPVANLCMVRVTGELSDSQSVAFAADASKNGWAMVAVASIPEPTTATLSLLALAGLAARRRRK